MPEATWVPGIPEWETSVPVELVRAATRDGVALAGMLRKPKQEGASRLGVDLVLLMHGSAGNFYSHGMFSQYTAALVEQGCAVLRVNNRGHDPVSESGSRRFGNACEVIDDCLYDWEAWIDFAEAAGYERIALWGHSKGAVKSIYYMSVQHDPRVKCVVAASPPRWNFDHYAVMKEGQEFKQDYSRAKQLIDEGDPEAFIEVNVPLRQLISAGSWMEKYGPDAKYDYLLHIPNVRVPLLLSIGSAEEEGPIALAFRGMPPLLEKLAAELEHLTFEFIPGANHAYSLQRQHLWEVVARWLRALMKLAPDTRSSSELPEYRLTPDELARFAGTYGDPPRTLQAPSGEPVTAIRVHLRDGALYWEAQMKSGEIRTSAGRPCAEYAILVDEGDGQRRQFLTERDGTVWALIVGPWILRKLE